MKNGITRFYSIFFIFLFIITIIFFFNLEKKYHIEIPLQFSGSRTPIVTMNIENNKYPVVFDLGNSCPFSLDSHIISNLKNKEHIGNCSWKDFWGKKYESLLYEIPIVDIGVPIRNVEVKEESNEYKNNCILYEEEDEKDEIYEVGSIGRTFIDKYNILMDFNNSRIILSNNLSKLKSSEYDLSSFIKISLKNNSEGIIFPVQTNIGEKLFFLDTGSTGSALRSSLINKENIHIEEHGIEVFTTNKLEIEGVDFGKQDLFLLDISSELKSFDGVLGMDFIKKHVCYIDFEKGYLYIQKP